MARKPTNPFGMPKARNPFTQPKPKKPDAPPAPRKQGFEDTLCQAIANGIAVILRYQKPGELADTYSRTFGPTAVYRTEQGKVCVSGEEISNPNEPTRGSTPHNFEVGRIIDLSIAAQTFQPSATVDYSQAKYRNGVICRR